ncbi:hypothetical protein BDV35DRAFT_335683 [Aspergillus flavus]|uniref:Uncharacterized protein n=1 Tax=Aspergillus flavus TaxID=5059 RepID=A0A5N6HFZ1_ASPFL|nr:hypothetical protein BDV35DRAFT_335683 [Aspergillus flavus]
MSHDPSRNKLEISVIAFVLLIGCSLTSCLSNPLSSPSARGNSNIPLHRRLHRSDRHPDLCSIPSTRRTAPSYHMRRRSPLRGPVRHNAIHRALSSPCGSETTWTAIHVEPARSCLGRSCSAIPFPWSFCIPKSWLSDSAFPFLWWPWG